MKRLLLLILVVTTVISGTPASADVGPAAVPPPPTDVQASDGTFVNRVRVTWSAVSSASRYQVDRKAQWGAVWAVIATHVTNTYHDDLNATHNTRYYYRVSACNSHGCSATSWPLDYGHPGLAAPTNVQATDGAYTNRVCLTWSEVSGADSYKVYVGTSSAGHFKVSYAPGYGTTPFCDTSLTPGVLYYFWVRAFNDVDESSSGKFDTGYQKLGQPINVLATDGVYCDKTRVNWRSIEGATYYKVRRGDDSLSYSQEWIVSNNTFDDASGVVRAMYYYSVVACAATGCGDASTTDPGYRGQAPAPDSVSASQGLYHDRVHVEWSASLGASHYNLYEGVQGTVYYLLASGITTTWYDGSVKYCV